VRGRLRTALLDRTGLALLAASLLLALVLQLVPGLEPWRERSPLIGAWGAVVYCVASLLSFGTAARGLPGATAPVVEPPPSAALSLSTPPTAPYPDGLTRREVEVLRLLAAGQTNRQIARVLSVSVPTAERHIANLYVKIGAHGRADATAYAHRRGLVT
jgi:DNA-binding CsgD family transcriptional regulator